METHTHAESSALQAWVCGGGGGRRGGGGFGVEGVNPRSPSPAAEKQSPLKQLPGKGCAAETASKAHKSSVQTPRRAQAPRGLPIENGGGGEEKKKGKEEERRTSAERPDRPSSIGSQVRRSPQISDADKYSDRLGER